MTKSLALAVVGVWLLAVTVDLLTASELCNPAIYRCVGSQVAFAYNRRSECREVDSGLNCTEARVRCVCINVAKVCVKALQYGNASSDPAATTTAGTTSTSSTTTTTTTTASTATSTLAPTTGSTSVATTQAPTAVSALCQLPYAGDNEPCLTHKQCYAVSGGVALCCSGQCKHVHNVPCVRDFFKKEDQLCDDTQFKALFSAAQVANNDD